MFFTLLLFCALSTTTITPHDESRYSIIPKPLSLLPIEGHCVLTKSTKIFLYTQNTQDRELARFIASFLGKPLGAAVQVRTNALSVTPNALSIFIDDTYTMKPDWLNKIRIMYFTDMFDSPFL